MGLLDDAIREHLELKRRRGADPSEVAREEHEALDAGYSTESSLHDGDHEPPSPEAAHDAEGVQDHLGEEAPGAAHPEDPGAAHEEDSGFGQETAELDMSAVLDQGRDTPSEEPAAAAPSTKPVRAASSAELPDDEDLDWGPAGPTASTPTAEEAPGQERLSLE